MTVPERTPLHCSHRPPCPGCPRLGEGLERHPALQPLATFAAEVGVPLQLEAGCDPRGYRVRARLAVRGRAASPKLGIFQAGSHRIADIPSCLVQHEAINHTAAVLKQAMRELRVEPYADAPHRGLVRYLQVAVERASERVQLVLVANCADRAPLEPLLARLSVLLGPRLQGLFFSLHPARSNAILGAECVKVQGEDALEERILGARVFFPPDAFGQSNLGLYERIVERIVEAVPMQSDVLELYAGSGAIGLCALSRSRRVRFNELAKGSLCGLRLGIDALPEALRARTEVHPGAAGDAVALLGDADVVVADPPRKGLDPPLCAALAAQPPPRFLYLSCGFASFLEDARALLAGGRMRLAALSVFDLFPFTEHVELLARFERAG